MMAPLVSFATVSALTRYVASLILTVVAVSPVAAEDVATYPSATIRIIVPYPAGGTADALPRIISDRLQARWNQPVIIVNRPGAGGNIGAETVAVAEPNGYTLLASPPGPLVINEALYKELTFRPSEFEPVIVMGSVPNVMDGAAWLPCEISSRCSQLHTGKASPALAQSPHHHSTSDLADPSGRGVYNDSVQSGFQSGVMPGYQVMPGYDGGGTTVAIPNPDYR